MRPQWRQGCQSVPLCAWLICAIYASTSFVQPTAATPFHEIDRSRDHPTIGPRGIFTPFGAGGQINLDGGEQLEFSESSVDVCDKIGGTCLTGIEKKHRIKIPKTLSDLLGALDVMQAEYFELWAGTWPSSIDWTAAVLGTHVSATLTTLISSIDYSSTPCSEILQWENTINRYFSHISAFYFGENAFSLRNQAFDDMLWVVLGWLENVKFSTLYSRRYWQSQRGALSAAWHGTQLRSAAAHRARIFYEIASQGWGTDLCNGGMNWNPVLEPYKNAITNELFISASIAMYLYFPGDDSDSPFLATGSAPRYPPHEKSYLDSAIDGYEWLKKSNMTNNGGLYMDGFHISGWRRDRNGTTDPGSRQCDKINRMVFTYNQGVLLSGLRGLWLATKSREYLEDGHKLVQSVILATGWPRTDTTWAGLGRAGVLEEYCDARGDCSQNGHTFKGIFFHHLAEFCRPLWPHEEHFMSSAAAQGMDDVAYRYHQNRCLSYAAWIEHNAHAALATRDDQGKFGTWWGRESNSSEDLHIAGEPLPEGAVDYRNGGVPNERPRRVTPGIHDHNAAESRFGSASEAISINQDVNDRGRGRTVETQSGGVAVLRALWQWDAILGSRESTAGES